MDDFEDKVGLTSLGQIKLIVEGVSKESAKQERKRIVERLRQLISEDEYSLSGEWVVDVYEIEQCIKNHIEKESS